MSAMTVARMGMDALTRRRTIILSILTGASALFVFTKAYPERLVPVNTVQALFLVGLAVVGLLVALARIRIGIAVVGVIQVLLGVIRLVTDGSGSGIITGGIGTASLLVGLGIAFIGVYVASRALPIAPNTERDE